MRRLSLIFALALAACVPEGAFASPRHVHLSWQGPTDTTMTVTWRADEPTGTVEFGTDPSYGQTATAKSSPFQGSYVHVAELTGLTPNTAYQYRVGSSGAMSPGYSFRTAPPAGTPFTFAAWGDSRSNDSARAKVMGAIASRMPALSVTTGDLVGEGTNQAEWDQWFTTVEPLIANSPTMTILGNHEAHASNYFTQFTMPTHPSASGYEDEAYYSFDYGNVHFVGLSTEDSRTGAQLAWLKADLEAARARPSIRWIIAFAHRPPYSSGSHGSDTEVRNVWGPVFEQYGVDLSFWGHDHHYERTKPMRGGSPAADGPVYVVTGGAGAPLYAVGSSDFTAFARSINHWTEVSVTDTELKLEARDVTNQVLDSLTLKHELPAPERPTETGGPQQPPSGSPSSPAPADGSPTGAPVEGDPAPKGRLGCSTAGAGTWAMPGLLALTGAALRLRSSRRKQRGQQA